MADKIQKIQNAYDEQISKAEKKIEKENDLLDNNKKKKSKKDRKKKNANEKQHQQQLSITTKKKAKARINGLKKYIKNCEPAKIINDF